MRWPRSSRQARGHAIVLALVLWAAAAFSLSGSGDQGIAGRLKSPDFVFFYTQGYLARSHQAGSLYDAQAVFDTQVSLLPSSRSEIYPPVYPPQAAVLFAPFSYLSYGQALALWSLLTIALYAAIVMHVWRAVSEYLPDRVFVAAAAAAFPPFWSVIVYGQITVVLLVAFWAGWWSLDRGRSYLAGIAFGILAIKPQFGIPLAAIVLACREWKMLGGALTSVAVQAAVVWAVLGWTAFESFAAYLPVTLVHADLLEAKPFFSHSLRSLTRLAPAWIGMPLWVALVSVVLWYTVRVWKSAAPLKVRLATMIVASVLVNPHLIVYDAAVLALPLIWCGAFMQEPGQQAHRVAFWTTVYWLFAALFAPTAAVIGLQVSVLLMIWLFAQITRAVLSAAPASFDSAVVSAPTSSIARAPAV